MELTFLSLTEVLAIHQDQVQRYGGASGIRDIELLHSAIGMPSTTYSGEFLHTDICEMAAAYLFHLVMMTESIAFSTHPTPSWPGAGGGW